MILLYNPTSFKSVVAIQNAKKGNLPTDFRNALARFNQSRAMAVRGASSPNLARPTNPTSLSLDARLRNSKMVSLLTGRKWTLYERSGGEQWFFEFSTIGPVSNAQGRCLGKRGVKLHHWRQWMIRNGVLVIDGRAKYVFDNVTMQWKQSDGGTSFLR